MNISKLLSGAAVAALALGVSSPALAFDTVDWSWTLSRTDISTKTTTSSLEALPFGDIAVESRQIYIGDVRSNSDATGIATPLATITGPLDASTEVGAVEAKADSYANVSSTESAFSLSSDVGQFHVGDIDLLSGATPGVPDVTATNFNHAYADRLIADNGTGFFTPHEVTATANALDVENASALAEAMSVSNSASNSMEVAQPYRLTDDITVTDALMASDLTQLSIGQVSSVANSSVSMNGFDNLGALDRPIASSVTTSIGNLGTTSAKAAALSFIPI